MSVDFPAPEGPTRDRGAMIRDEFKDRLNAVTGKRVHDQDIRSERYRLDGCACRDRIGGEVCLGEDDHRDGS